MTLSKKTVIIFHPGSRHLYFGRSTDPSPQSIFQIIARKKTTGSSPSPSLIRRDRIVPISEKKLAEKIPHEVESARLQLSLTLQSALKSLEEGKSSDGQGRKITLTSISSVAELNKNAKKIPLLAKPISPHKGTTPQQLEDEEFIVGEDVINLNPNDASNFNIFCPWRRGQLNINRQVGGSITAVVKDLEDIWKWCITEKLGMTLKDLKSCRAVLIIPAMFDRVHAKELMNMLLKELGFKSAFLIQDHICASFGCGVACATVVDVGDQKISVSCVEDGVSYPQSRLELKYGGGDLTVALWNQFHHTGFPLPLDISQQWDLEFLNCLKEKYCAIDLPSWRSGPREEKILLEKPGQVPVEYHVHFGDELTIVPLAYFNPDLLRGSIGSKAVICYGPQPSVSDDPFDKLYLAETALSRKSGVNEECEDEDGGEEHTRTVRSSSAQNSKKLAFEIPLGIDQAICQSIECCNVSNDLKQRWYSCIIVVGGGFKINGLTNWLQDRINSIISSKEGNPDEEMDIDSDATSSCSSKEQKTPLTRIITSPKNDGDPSTIVWKGGAILSSLDTAKELWITQREWSKLGSKILREKSLFHY